MRGREKVHQDNDRADDYAAALQVMADGHGVCTVSRVYVIRVRDGDRAYGLVGMRKFMIGVLPHNRGKMPLLRDFRFIRWSGILPRLRHDFFGLSSRACVVTANKNSNNVH